MRMNFPGGFIPLLLFLCLLIMPASAEFSIRIDDPITEVYYDVCYPNGTIYLSNLNSSEICALPEDGHYTIMLHSSPMRIAEDPGSFMGNLINYGYAVLFCAVLLFLAGSISGIFLGQFIRRRN